jgi:DNA helicase-2/ATP-dependent DNA helicase PcrA
MIATIDKINTLNAAQKAVLNSDEKRILVLAGPGAGKTFVLTEWIKQQLEENEKKSYKILGLTFTNKAADEMDKRLPMDLESRDKINLMTFHGLGAKILRQFGYHIGVPANFKICNDDAEKIEILKTGLKRAGIQEEYNWSKCLNIIADLKKNLISPNENELGQEKYTVLNNIYINYQKELFKSDSLDYDDLLFQTVKLLKTYPAFGKHYQKNYPYISVDEFQDTNLAQYEILKYLITEDTKLLTVGDDNQLIYEWNGASHKRLNDFKKEYNPTVIHLPLNYRCPNEIVEISNKLIAKNEIRLGDFQPNKASNNEKSNSCSLLKFNSFEEESAAIAYDIVEKHHYNLGEVVVLARRKKLLDKVVNHLRKQNVPYNLYERKGEFVSVPLAWLSEVLEFFNAPNREISAKIVTTTFNQIAGIEIDFSILKNLKEKGSENINFLSLWLNAVNNELDTENPFKALIDLVEQKLTLKNYRSFSIKVLKWFDDYFKEITKDKAKASIYNFEEYTEEKEVWKSLTKSVFSRLGSEIPLSSFLQELSLQTKETPPSSDKVNLMTIHASKGQGFEHVYLVGMVNDELPSYYAIKNNSQKAIEEERRNCYVAITRASKTLTLSYADRYDGWNKKPSLFLFDMEIIK